MSPYFAIGALAITFLGGMGLEYKLVQAGYVSDIIKENDAVSRVEKTGNASLVDADNKIADLNRTTDAIKEKWSAENAHSKSDPCVLPDSTRRVLREATAAARNATATSR